MERKVYNRQSSNRKRKHLKIFALIIGYGILDVCVLSHHISLFAFRIGTQERPHQTAKASAVISVITVLPQCLDFFEVCVVCIFCVFCVVWWDDII